MRGHGIPAAVRRFVAEHLDSVEALEVLLLLFRKPERWWCAREVAGELGTLATSAEASLEALASARLLDARLGSAVLFRYGPVSPELDAGVRLLDQSCRERRVALINTVASRGIDPIQSFADAFRVLRRKQDLDE